MTDKYVTSILDTDLYKLTMQQAVFRQFPNSMVEYKFINRSKTMLHNGKSIEAIVTALHRLESVFLQEDEYLWLKETCPYFSDEYLEFLKNFRFKPKEQITMRYIPSFERIGYGELELEFKGPWKETMLYETPVMAIISESYFANVDTDWSMDGQEELAYLKAKALFEQGITMMEFGTRRRRSKETQNLVLQGLLRADGEYPRSESGRIFGTSNVHFAHMYGLTPMGTIAHEWSMGIGALYNYEKPNLKALELWEEVYPASRSSGQLIALTDTFSSAAFFKDFALNLELAKRWRGLRQDSGDPLTFIKQAHEAYTNLGIDHTQKTIVFSDSLNVDACIRIKKASDEAGFISAFGVGTSLTNDFKASSTGEKSKATNIVIKLSSIDGIPCVKISDELMKNTGTPAAVRNVKEKFGLPTQ